MTDVGTPQAPTAPGTGSVLTSEWRKMRALRSTPIGIALILVVSVGVGVFMTLIGGSSAISEAQAESGYSIIFYSSGLTTWAFVFLAASFVAAEFTGMGEATFVATARRGRIGRAHV